MLKVSEVGTLVGSYCYICADFLSRLAAKGQIYKNKTTQY